MDDIVDEWVGNPLKAPFRDCGGSRRSASAAGRPSAMREQLPFRGCGGDQDEGSTWLAAEELGPLGCGPSILSQKWVSCSAAAAQWLSVASTGLQWSSSVCWEHDGF